MSGFIQFLRRYFVVWGGGLCLFLLFATPLPDWVFFAFARAVIMNTIASDEWIIQDRLKREGLDGGQDAHRLARDYRRLKSLASAKGTVSSAKYVHVVMVETGNHFSAVSSANHGPYVQGELDLAYLADSALVIIADQPYIWHVKNGSSVPAARLGFEGRAPFDLRNAQKGLLAGFRVASFGFTGTVGGNDFYKRNCRETRQRICYSLNVWKNFFSVDGKSVGVWHVTDPKSLQPIYDGLASDSSDQSFLGDIGAVCGAELVEDHSDFCSKR